MASMVVMMRGRAVRFLRPLAAADLRRGFDLPAALQPEHDADAVVGRQSPLWIDQHDVHAARREGDLLVGGH